MLQLEDLPGWGNTVIGDLLILGARSVLQSAKDKSDRSADGPCSLAARVGYWKAVVAIAAKNARMGWALLQRGRV